MKKILLCMLLAVVIIVGVMSSADVLVKDTFNADQIKAIKTDISNAFDVQCGDLFIGEVVEDYVSISIYSHNYASLSKFISNYNLKEISSYCVENVCVKEYYSSWFNCNGVYNFQVADYGDKYIIGYPYIFEGF